MMQLYDALHFGVGAIASQERFPAAHFGSGGSFLGRKSIACVIIEGLMYPDFALDTSIAHFQISADITSIRDGLTILLVATISFSEAIFELGNTNLYVMHLAFGTSNFGTKLDKSLGGKRFDPGKMARWVTKNHHNP